MKIVYISALPKTMSGGPKYSVPNQVNAQSVYDEVFWINITPFGVKKSTIPCECIKNIKDVLDRINKIQTELVIFEDFYYIEFHKIAKALKKSKIPYIIVPRGSMTKKAQQQKWYKKIPANLLFFNSFATNALAIEYLTEDERDNSSSKWNKNAVIVPNGTKISSVQANPSLSKEIINGVFIGRIELFQKGLDVFITVCSELRSLLIQKKCKIHLYGPCGDETKRALVDLIEKSNLESVVFIESEIHNQEKEKVLVNSDFFILTSRFEGLPMGLLEALSYGLPSLVTDETNIGKKIQSCGAGLSSPFDKELIRKNLERFLKMNDTDISEMSKKAFEFSKQYDWKAIAKEAHEEYKKLLKLI